MGLALGLAVSRPKSKCDCEACGKGGRSSSRRSECLVFLCFASVFMVFHGFRLSLMSGGADGRPAAASRAAESCLRRREREQQRESEGLEAGQRHRHAPRASQMPCGRAFLRLVLQPSSLRQAMRCLELCSRAQVAVLPQGANTSLTGGSVPRDECDRPFAAGRNLRSGPYKAGKRLYN